MNWKFAISATLFLVAWCGLAVVLALMVSNAFAPRKPKEPTTHDYSREKRYWGHDYCIIAVIEQGRELRMAGWSHGIESGDFILMENGNETTRYKVEFVNYLSDPTDMWNMTASFAPRSATATPPNPPPTEVQPTPRPN